MRRTNVSRHRYTKHASPSYLVEFEANKTSNKRSSGSDRWNDLACDLLRVVTIRRFDIVVQRTKVGSCCDEVDVMVRIIILLKLDWVQSIARHRRRWW